MSRKLRYINPFEGKPSALPLSDLFLFSPTVDMKLAGQPIRSVFAAKGKESLFKRMELLQKKESRSVKGIFTELLEMFPGAPLNRQITAALDGDETAYQYVQSLGLWETYLYDKWAVPNPSLTELGAFILEIERASKEPMRLVQQGQFAEAASILSMHPVMCQFLWPRALSIFSSVSELSKLLPLQASVALEIRLSLVALADVTLSLDKPAGESSFMCLVPSQSRQNLNPTSQFFRWLQREVGVEKIDALLDKNSFIDSSVANSRIDASTLKGWSSGSHEPNPVWLQALEECLFGNSGHEQLWEMYEASRQLNFIGHIAEKLIGRTAGLIRADQQMALAPWPNMPFDCESIPSWFETRYPFWLVFHDERLRSLKHGDDRPTVTPSHSTASSY